MRKEEWTKEDSEEFDKWYDEMQRQIQQEEEKSNERGLWMLAGFLIAMLFMLLVRCCGPFDVDSTNPW